MNLRLNKAEAVLLLSVLQQSISSLERKYSDKTILEGPDNGYLKETAQGLILQMNTIQHKLENLIELND